MKAKDAEKLKALEAFSIPDRITSEWLDAFELYPTFDFWLKQLPTESAGRKLVALMPVLKLARGKVPPNFYSNISKWYFEQKVTVSLNSNVHDAILLAQHRLESANLVLQIESLYSASNPSVRWTDVIDLAKFTTLLVGACDDLSSNLRELGSFKLAAKDISRKYGEGHSLLLGDFAAKLEDLYEKTVACAHEYERTREELLSSFGFSGTELPQELLEIDYDTIDKLAVNESYEIARVLVNSATKQMQIAFEQPQAL